MRDFGPLCDCFERNDWLAAHYCVELLFALKQPNPDYELAKHLFSLISTKAKLPDGQALGWKREYWKLLAELQGEDFLVLVGRPVVAVNGGRNDH